MKTSEFKYQLESHPQAELRFILPDDDLIPAHAHITEIGRVDKTFIDCGSTVRKISSCNLQAWVADDVEHRLAPGKLAAVLATAAPLFGDDDLEVELEYEDCNLSQFPVLRSTTEAGVLIFHLGAKHTDCLAKDVCLSKGETSEAGIGCCGGGNC